MADYLNDPRVVMTLDAGGTSFRFSAMGGNQQVTPTIAMPTESKDLGPCMEHIIEGFMRVRTLCPAPPTAISFAFPGPADYPNGIIGDLPNLPCFRGGVALGPELEEHFQIPVFINNDGDLFAYGEAIGGFLPYVNGLLKEAGSPKRFKNLLGVTLGTGFGGGIVRDGELFIGDNSIAAEVWLLRNKLEPQMHVEEGASIRAVRRAYVKASDFTAAEPTVLGLDPYEIGQIALGISPGHQTAAIESYRRLGEIVGDAMGNALTLIDGLAVIGGGLSKAHALFLPALMKELNSYYTIPGGKQLRRLASVAFNLEDPKQLEKFLKGDTREIPVSGGTRKIKYDPLQRIGVGISRLGTSEAIALGAYAFALRKLDR